MVIFKYSLFAKLIYRYGNFVATPVLLIHLISSIIGISRYWYFSIFALINIGVLIVLNSYFWKTYKLFPFKVIADDEKLKCSNYFFSSKEVIIYYKDIDRISGGIFSSSLTKPMMIEDSKNKVKFGFYAHVGSFNKLLTKILQHIPQPIYNSLLRSLKEKRAEFKTKKPIK